MQLIRCAGTIVLSIALGGLVGCSRPDPSATVSKALQDANLDEVKVDWDKDAGIAHLKGVVSSASDRERAADVAAIAVGTGGRVVNDIVVDDRSADHDAQIRSELKQLVERDQTLRSRDIDFEVINQVVIAKGRVQSVAERDQVAELVRTAPGVKDFANQLEVITASR